MRCCGAEELESHVAETCLPYSELRSQIPFVMVAHASYPEVTNNKVPHRSQEVDAGRAAQENWFYRGLIISDDLEWAACFRPAEIEDVAVEPLRAGATWFLCAITRKLVWRGLKLYAHR